MKTKHLGHALLATFALASTLQLTGCYEDMRSSDGAGLRLTDGETDKLFQEKNIGTFKLHGTKKIVLTYDDGPTPGVTEPLLDLLRKYNIKATFFMLGQAVHGQTDTLKRMKADGHLLANHSYSHQNLSTNLYYTDLYSLLHEVKDADTRLSPYMDHARPRYFRAPYGAWTKSHAAKLNRIEQIRDYVGPVYWDVGGEVSPSKPRPMTEGAIRTAADWSCWTSNEKKGIRAIPVSVCAAGYLKEIESMGGGVVLMHDKDIRTVQLSAILIPKLIELGYEFVNLDELRALEPYNEQVPVNATLPTRTL